MTTETEHTILPAGKTYLISRRIVLHFMKRGIHCYPEAATMPELATGDKYDVSYLAHPHAHDFWFRVELEVRHDDRDIEFIQLRERILDWYEQGDLQCGRKSCEMLAEELISKLDNKYPGRQISVSVFEDSLHANGATVTSTPLT